MPNRWTTLQGYFIIYLHLYILHLIRSKYTIQTDYSQTNIVQKSTDCFTWNILQNRLNCFYILPNARFDISIHNFTARYQITLYLLDLSVLHSNSLRFYLFFIFFHLYFIYKSPIICNHAQTPPFFKYIYQLTPNKSLRKLFSLLRCL